MTGSDKITAPVTKRNNMAMGYQQKQQNFTKKDFAIKQSSIRGIGKGLFALRTIYRGDTIGLYTGIVLKDAQCYAAPYVNSHYTLWVCKDCNIVAEGKNAGYTRYINHSDRPNARFVVSTRWKKARVEAIKRIRPGEEVFIDYGPAFWEASQIMKKHAK
jgi:SET domain-containing protein